MYRIIKRDLDKNSRVLLLLIVAVYLLRLIYLDADVKAPWGIINYQPVDECAYANIAMNYVNFGTINPNDYYQGKYNYDISGNSINNLIGNIFTFLSFAIFGDNYWGLRIGTVLAGFIVLLMFYFALMRVTNKDDNEIRICSAICLVTSFVYYNACRIVEPSIFRMLFVTLIFLLFVINGNSKLTYFFMGWCTVASVLLVYITNTFIFFALFAVFIYRLVKGNVKSAFTFFVWNFGGGVTAYLISFIYYYVSWRRTPLKNAIDTIYSFSQAYSSYNIQGTSIVTYLKRIIAFTSSNIFLYCPFILGLLILFIPLIKKVSKKNKENIIFIYGLCGGLLVQTIVSEDYIVRKGIVIGIVALLGVVIMLSERKLYVLDKKDSRRVIISTVIAIEIMFFNCIYRLYLIGDGTLYDFSPKDKLFVWGLCISSIIIVICISYKLIGAMSGYNWLTRTAFVLLIILNVMFIIKYDLYKMTYTQKDTMIEVGEIVGDGIVCLQYENTISLYNDIKPLVCLYDEIDMYIKNDNDIYYYGYDDFENHSSDINSISNNVHKVKSFPVEFYTFGIRRNWALYKYGVEDRSRMYGKQVLILGDSFSTDRMSYDQIVLTENWGNILEKETGGIVHNMSIAGSCAAMRSEDEAQGINGDSLLSIIKRLDLKKYDFLVLAYGTSDLNNSIPVGSMDSKDEYTFIGALNEAIKYAKRTNDQLQIVIVTPLIGTENSFKYDDAIISVGNQNDCIIADLEKIYSPILSSKDIYAVSGKYANKYMHKAIADYISDVVSEDINERHVISYIVNGNEETEIEHQVVMENHTIDLMPTPSKPGNIFIGWYSNELDMYIDESYSYTQKKDIKLIPQWEYKSEN